MHFTCPMSLRGEKEKQMSKFGLYDGPYFRIVQPKEISTYITISKLLNVVNTNVSRTRKLKITFRILLIMSKIYDVKGLIILW